MYNSSILIFHCCLSFFSFLHFIVYLNLFVSQCCTVQELLTQDFFSEILYTVNWDSNNNNYRQTESESQFSVIKFYIANLQLCFLTGSDCVFVSLLLSVCLASVRNQCTDEAQEAQQRPPGGDGAGQPGAGVHRGALLLGGGKGGVWEQRKNGAQLESFQKEGLQGLFSGNTSVEDCLLSKDW